MQAADGGTLDVRRSDEGKRNLKMKENSSSNPFKGPTQQPSGAEPKSQTFINFLIQNKGSKDHLVWENSYFIGKKVQH